MTFLLAVTLTSMLLAAIMSVVAWRISGEERRRSEARVAALAAEIHDGVAEQSVVGRRAEMVMRNEPMRLKSVPATQSPPRQGGHDFQLRSVDGAPSVANLFSVQPARSGWRSAAAMGAGALVLGTSIALALVMSGGSRGVARSANQPTPAVGASPSGRAAPATAPVPLELVALGHERDGDRLIVRGVVRNPASGAARDRVTAVVFLFNRDGGFLASGRATVDEPTLHPGSNSTFVVAIPGAGDVGRYRLSFRTDDRILPHVDRRTVTKT
ncbi:MAG: hypothetical protein DMF95_04805 [Acidobacteria bacterium]|nr:MAG: hypothetical protein DMF96_18420 [Acidobacteriota bacterium]PYR53241.1 MAG: hypothetical protein DMF95_04805 [Acidobacteriota bacterium]